jgi:SAM-dependent methyltransferase
MTERVFDDLTDIYEAMVDWPKRLANEAPFYRRIFERVAARRVLDVACGTGRHAAMLHSWGLEVEAADISPGMLDRARATFGQPAGLRWVLRGFDQPAEPEAFDVAICVGNSLALAPDMATVQRAIHAMLAAVRGGGAIVIQVLNLWHLADGPCQWQKCKQAELPQGRALITKGVHRSGTRGYVDLVATDLGRTEMRTESVPFLGLEDAELERIALAGGAVRVSVLGGYQEQPYDRQTSVDLVVVAEK